MLNERKLTKSELKKREDIVKDMKKNKRELIKRYGKDAEAIMYGRATKLAKQKTESMNPDKIREMIKDALQNPKKADLNKDGKLSSYEKKRGAAIEKSMKKQDLEENEFGGMGLIVRGKTSKDNDLIDQAVEESEFYGIYNSTEDYWFFPEEGDQSTMDQLENELETIFIKKGADVSYEGQFYESMNEDLDLGHQDNEPHMLKKNLYHIGKYAMELYQMVDQFEYKGEVDFPHWWQSKIVKAESMISSAKHYLEFELKEPEIDAMVDVASKEDAIDEGMSEEEFAKAKEEDRLAKLPMDQQAKIKKAIAMLKAEKKSKK